MNATDIKDALSLAFLTGRNLKDLDGKLTSRPDGATILTVPDNTRDVVLPPLNPALAKAHPQFHDLESFLAYVNRFSSEATRIFGTQILADPKVPPVLHAVLDYHHPEQPNNGNHRATYQMRWSEQWTRWTQTVSGAVLSQPEFAELIEETRRDIAEPDAAQLMDTVRAFKAGKAVEYDSLVYQPNGSVMLNYSEKVEQKGPGAMLPETMKLGIPVFFRGTPFSVPCFVRYRLTGGAVKFNLKIDRADIIVDEAFAEVIKTTAETTGIEVYRGSIGTFGG